MDVRDHPKMVSIFEYSSALIGAHRLLSKVRVRTPVSTPNQIHSNILGTIRIPKMYLADPGDKGKNFHLKYRVVQHF